MTESQKPPKSDARFVRSATFPSMKSKMLATIMTKPAVMNAPVPRAHADPALMMTPMNVNALGWIRRRTQRSMMARRGYMHAAPRAPVKVMLSSG